MPIRAEGYAFRGGEFFFWGDGAYRWVLRGGVKRGLPERIAGATYLEGGCALDVNGDGRNDLVLIESAPSARPGAPPDRTLVWLEAPAWKRHPIDRGVDSLDMLPAELFGKRGVLLIHKRMQVRFYAIPVEPESAWPETEIYSFYTPSEEGGLALADVDGDGRPDILAGDYFIQSPASFELPWHLWAIDTWTEAKSSALLRVVWIAVGKWPATRVAIQRAMSPARFAWFDRETDFKKLWTAHSIGEEDQLSEPRTMFAMDFLGGTRTDLVVAERAGKGRLLVYWNRPDGFRSTELFSGRQWQGAFAADLDGVRPSLIAFDERDIFSFYAAR